MKLPLKIAAFLFVAVCFVVVGKRMLSTDWANQPSLEQIQIAHNAIPIPANIEEVSFDSISKVTFTGYSTRYRSDMSLDAAVSLLEKLASELNWQRKYIKQGPSLYRTIYCSGRMARDIEIRPRPADHDVVIIIGTYWAADTKDARYCR